MDCHSIFPTHYISSLVDNLDALDADNVGGTVKSVPADNTPTSEAIAIGLSSKYGVGNSIFRTGTNTVREVDTVPFGCYPKRVFDDIGVFDIELTRNQDDEFNARLRKNNGRIFLIPSIEIIYYTRNSFRKASKMFYQYGLFKPLANKKSGVLSSYRQLAPPTLIFALAVSLAAWLLTGLGSLPFAALTIVYSIFILIATASCKIPSRRFSTRMLLALVFPTIQLSYGVGYWKGLILELLSNKLPDTSGTSR